MILGHIDIGALGFVVEFDGCDLGRLESLGNQHLDGIIPTNDIDLFAAEFIGDIPDPGAFDADASTDTVDVGIQSCDGDLGPVSRFSRYRLDLNDIIRDLGDFLLEEPPHEVRSSSGHQQLNPGLLHVHFLEDHLDAISLVPFFEVGLLASGHESLCPIGQGDDEAPALATGDGTIDHLANAVFKLAKDDFTLCFTNFLEKNLLASASCNASQNLTRIESISVSDRGDDSCFTVDEDLDAFFLVETFLGSGNQSHLDAREDHLFVDLSITMNRVNEAQDFFTHHQLLLFDAANRIEVPSDQT